MRHVTRTELLGRYEALPLPTTADEHWRFTDLRGFDPDAFVRNGHAAVPGTRTRPEAAMLDVDAAAVATVTEAGIEIELAPEGLVFEALSGEHPRLHEL